MANSYYSYDDVYGKGGTATMLTTFDWEVDFFKAPAIMVGDKSTDDAAEKVLNGKFLSQMVQWNAIDTPDNAPVTISIRGHQLSQPGLNTWSGGVTFASQDLSDLTITKYFNIITQAQDDSERHSTRGRSPNAFRFGFDIYRLNPAGHKVMRWHCNPCIMVAFAGPASGDNTKSPATQCSVTFQVDHFTIQFPKSGIPTDSTSNGDWTDYSE